jgi:protocatechuate 3,4-dioxygenase beta subunit
MTAAVFGQQRETPKTGSIEGTVTAAGTGQPVSGARVTAQRGARPGPGGPAGVQFESFPPGVRMGVTLAPAAPTSVTDHDGKFVFSSLDEGSYTLTVQGNGYVEQSYGQRYPNGPGIPVALTGGQSVKNLSISLTPAGNVSGRVHDPSGQPVVNMPVQLLRARYNATGDRTYESVGSVRTNDRGEYRIYWVAPGRYYARAGTPTSGAGPLAALVTTIFGGNIAAGNNVAVPAGHSFYPGVTDLDAARGIDLDPGAELQAIDITFVPKPKTYRIRGRVIDARTGQPAANARLSAVPRSPGLEPTAAEQVTLDMSSDMPSSNYNRNTGAFEIPNLSPGTYGIKASVDTPGSDSGANSGTTTVVVTDSDVDGIAITAFPAATISGRLRVDGQLPAGTTPEQLRLMFIPSDPGGSGRMGFPPGKTDQDGSFTINKIFPGEYRYRLQPDFGSLYIKDARFEGVDVLNVPFRFTGSVSGTFDVTIGVTQGRVTGVVNNSKSEPAPVTRVLLIPDDRRRTELYKVASTDASGHFTFAGIAPGDYKVFSWERIEEYSWFDPDVVAAVDTRGRAVHVTETSTDTVDVTAIPPGAAR